jgi:ribosomal protein L36
MTAGLLGRAPASTLQRMSDPRTKPSVPRGLCEQCRYVRRVVSAKGSVFVLCERAKHEPAYPKYPRLPVLACPGFESGTA